MREDLLSGKTRQRKQVTQGPNLALRNLNPFAATLLRKNRQLFAKGLSIEQPNWPDQGGISLPVCRQWLLALAVSLRSGLLLHRAGWPVQEFLQEKKS